MMNYEPLDACLPRLSVAPPTLRPEFIFYLSKIISFCVTYFSNFLLVCVPLIRSNHFPHNNSHILVVKKV